MPDLVIPDVISAWARHAVAAAGTRAGIRREVDFTSGSAHVTVTATDDPTGDKVVIEYDVSLADLASSLAGDGLDASGSTLVVDETELDHGGLGGLGDEDHPAYLANSLFTTRGDLVRRGASAPERVALGTSGQVLTSDGTDAVWGDRPRLLAYSDTQTDNTSTGSTEVDAINFTIPALAVGKAIQIEAHGRYSQSAGADRTLQLRTRVGSTTLTLAPITMASSGGTRRWRMLTSIYVRSASAATVSTVFQGSGTGGAALESQNVIEMEVTAEDLTSSQTFRFTSAISSTGTRSFTCEGFRAVLL